MLTLALLLAASPSIIVVHENALGPARAVAAQLMRSTRVATTLREESLAVSCAYSTACPERPVGAEALIVVTTGTNQPLDVRLELVTRDGVVAREGVVVSAIELLPAALAPALERLIEAAQPSAAAPAPSNDGGGAWQTVLVGGGIVCAGLCVVGLAGGAIYALVAGTNAVVDGISGACNETLTNACNAPLDGCISGFDSCSSASDALTCASGVGRLSTLEEPQAPPTLEARGTQSTRGAMNY